ncbi:hypothetical protein EJ05DRAFT_251045 [Pseudovirgaria hyperparasitica]|uniref:Uncharacterized protein n=1 Tax=Pseudovirgaria hyperparasitica TaxID=470096 RepID=A0A6A6WFU2_9PEZI|nr:uncharacterized protein EJ05DRAFT_251045 [Pseudovirgaria hyperparasitica]KAF2761049.1 hypothetical protein EJ05DRAFT_251045 [Pseudovirgaria hyperparasitica]
MAHPRPDGQTLNSTNVSFMSSLWAIKAGTLEEKVQILWNGILNTYFPPTEPYKIAIKAVVLTDNTALDAVIFEIHALQEPRSSQHLQEPRSSHQLQERQIFMVECKRISEDTLEGWLGAQAQLLGYLESNSNVATCSGMYGACTIGSKVMFFEWIKDSHRLTAISPMLDMKEPIDRPVVEDMLIRVKQYGWIRTN